MKSSLDEVPSAATRSVVVPEKRPPRRRTSSDWSFQQRCITLFSLKISGKAVNVPGPSNREQDFSKSQPPQAKFPHKDKLSVATGILPIIQLRPFLGLKISAVVDLKPLHQQAPLTVRIPSSFFPRIRSSLASQLFLSFGLKKFV